MPIYYIKDKGEWVASSKGSWIPGVYASERAAKYAYRFPNEQLQELTDKLKRPITFEDLQSLRKNT